MKNFIDSLLEAKVKCNRAQFTSDISDCETINCKRQFEMETETTKAKKKLKSNLVLSERKMYYSVLLLRFIL